MAERTVTPVETYEDEAGRQWKRVTVQRCCNGCGRSLGDITEHEIDCAVAGKSLPDVRQECGCTNGDENHG